MLVHGYKIHVMYLSVAPLFQFHLLSRTNYCHFCHTLLYFSLLKLEVCYFLSWVLKFLILKLLNMNNNC